MIKNIAFHILMYFLGAVCVPHLLSFSQTHAIQRFSLGMAPKYINDHVRLIFSIFFIYFFIIPPRDGRH